MHYDLAFLDCMGMDGEYTSMALRFAKYVFVYSSLNEHTYSNFEALIFGFQWRIKCSEVAIVRA